MSLNRSPQEWLVGVGSRQQVAYLLAAIGVALGVGVFPDGWVSAGVWVFGVVGVVIGGVAGAYNYGVLPGLLGMVPYVAVVGQAVFLAQPTPDDPVVWATRGGLVLLVAALVLLIPSYLAGVGVRVLARRRASG